MAIHRFDPFREAVALQNRVNSIFRDLNANEASEPVAAASFVPAVDVYEDAKKIVIKLEVPGIDQKDLDIRVENHTLTVKVSVSLRRRRRSRTSIASNAAMDRSSAPSPCRPPWTRRTCRPVTPTASSSSN